LVRLKTVPTHEVPESDERFEKARYWVKYGNVKKVVAPLKKRVGGLDEAAWTPQGQESNIRLRRAFHDALGVNQIIFVFCDDLLQRVYQLPWWDDWKEELEPLFESIGVPTNRIIRCLLARLPCGVEIPTHHDTGFWATKSHRVHVPLFTSNQIGEEANEVVFKVGHNADKMERGVFAEGDVVELNNRAKHMVKNNWNSCRVHLIFDYVEPDYSLDRVVLSPGATVYQTRRAVYLDDKTGDGPSEYEAMCAQVRTTTEEERLQRSKEILNFIYQNCDVDKINFRAQCTRYVDGETGADEFLDYVLPVLGMKSFVKVFEEFDLPILITDPERQASLRKAYANMRLETPFFAVIGVMKCGTTSVYDYITQNPQVVRCRQKEPHFFDWQFEKVQAFKFSKKLRNEAEQAAGRACLDSSPVADKELLLKFMLAYPMDQLIANRHKTIVTGEATPSYLLGGQRLATRLKSIAPNVKLVVIMRDPVKRAYSQYQMTKDPTGTEEQKKRRGNVAGKSFELLIDEDLKALREIGVDGNAKIDSQTFEDKYLVNTPTGHGSHSYVGRGLYALQLKQWFKVFPREQFLFLKLDDLAKDVQSEMNKVFRFIGCDEYQIHDTEPKNSRKYEPMDPEIKKKLEAFYEPHNKELVELLGEHFKF